MRSPSVPSTKAPPAGSPVVRGVAADASSGGPPAHHVENTFELTSDDLEASDVTRRMAADEHEDGDGSGEVASPEEVRDALVQGDRLGNYVIDGVLGEGGGGTVYGGRHMSSARRVAIKVLHRDMAAFPTMVTRFVREAAAVNTIRHPNIVEILEFAEIEPGRPYYVMELLEGTDLRRLLRVHGRFTPREALGLLEPVCAAVQAAHEQGIIHRDIKASNVFIVDGETMSDVGQGPVSRGPASRGPVSRRNSRIPAPAEAGRAIKLLDFGIAKMLHSEGAGQGLTEPGVMLGTAHNMAPEQIRCDRADARTDIYALGVLFFQVLTGHYPFHADDPRQIAILHLQAPPPRPSASAPVPPAVDAVILRALEKKVDRRFPSVKEMLQALREAIGEPSPVSKDEKRQAVGIYLEITARTEDLDDAMIEDMGAVLDAAEHLLMDGEYVVPLHTSSALLGVRAAPMGASVDAERARADATVTELVHVLAARDGKHPDVEVTIAVRAAEATCRSGAELEVVGGPLLEVGTWPAETKVATV